MPVLLLNIAVTLVSSLLLAWMYVSWRRKGKHLPPGPPGLPFLGNILQMPREKEYLAFRDWANVYGDVIAFRVPGFLGVVLNSRKAIVELLDGRSSIYSDRPELVMCTDLVGWADAVITSNNNPRFRTCRKLLRKGLGPSAAQSFVPFLNSQSAFYLQELQKHPDTFPEVFKRNAARISMKIAYGYDGVTDDKELYNVGIQANHYFAQSAVFGVWLVDMIPILRFLPQWFPLAYFQQYAAHAKPIVLESVNRPFEETKRHMKQGTAGASFTTMLLQDAKGDADTEDCIKWSATGIFLGQMDTTTCVLSWFFMAMALHPEVQAKAQAEIDKVIGNERLPRVEDRESLPYIMAVMKEVFRWQPTVTIAPHAVSKDDEYHGYFIPAKTTVLANIWAALHDESVYHDAEMFIPERFSEEGAPDCLNLAFGFGRRHCPGILIAQAHVFVSIATTLATFNIAKAKDAAGNVIKPKVEGTSGAVNFPQPFKVSLQPRSEDAANLIRRSAEHSKTLPEQLAIFSVDE